jgi:hypothetical protein
MFLSRLNHQTIIFFDINSPFIGSVTQRVKKTTIGW